MDEPTTMDPEPEPEPVFVRNNPEAGTEDELQKKIRNAYYRFKLADNCTSLLKEVLNHDVFHAYKDKRTKFGGSFWDVIQAGATYINEPIGLFAPDPEAYSVFKPLFNVALDELHLGFHENDVQPTHTWGNYKGKIRSPDPTGQYIVSCRIRLCRNLVGYPFASCLTRTLLKEIEGKIVPVLKEMPCGLDGRYFPMEKLRDEIQKELRQDHILWNRPSKYLKAANVGRFWPSGRGIYMNKARNFFVWVGKDDHLRIISMSKSNDLQEVYERLVRGTMILENNLDFVHDDRLGYLTFDPANLGTTLRASYLIRLPRLMEVGFVEKYAEKFELEVRGTYGSRLPVKDGLYNIANKRRLGLTEFEAVMEFQLGITKLILEEQKLENDLKHEILEIASTISTEKTREEAKKKRMKSREKYWDSESNALLEEDEGFDTAVTSPSQISAVSSKKKGKKKEEKTEKKSKSKSGIEVSKSGFSGSSESASSIKTVKMKSSIGKKSAKLGSKSILENVESLGTASSFRASVSSETTKSKGKKKPGEKSSKKSTDKNNEVGEMSKASSNSSTSSDSSKKKEKRSKSGKISKKSKSKSSIEKGDTAFVSPTSPSTLSDSSKKKGKKSEGGKSERIKKSKSKNTENENASSAIFVASSTTILDDVKTRVKAREKVISLDET